MRSLAFAALPLLTLSLVPACATDDTTDELAGDSSTDDAIDGKADSAVDGASTYFEVWQDLRKCASPVCGGFYLARLNRSTTVCANGATNASCYTPVLDWTESNVDESTRAKLVDAANKDATTEGVYSIVRGRFAPKNSTPVPSLGRFIVTEAWVAEGTGVSEGVFARVKRNNIECITAPCPSLTEKGLNESNTANIAALDFTVSGLSDRQVQGFQDSLGNPEGILLAGSRYTDHENGHSAKGRTVTNAYHLLVNAPAAN